MCAANNSRPAIRRVDVGLVGHWSAILPLPGYGRVARDSGLNLKNRICADRRSHNRNSPGTGLDGNEPSILLLTCIDIE